MYTDISLADDFFSGYETKKGILENLSCVNILIGKNNSGKSRFLREIFRQESLKFKTKIFDQETLIEVVKRIKEVAKIYSQHDSYYPYFSLFSELEKIYEPDFISKQINLNKLFDKYIAPVETFYGDQFNDPHLKQGVRNTLAPLFAKLREVIKDTHSLARIKKIYFPTLRGLRPIQLDKGLFDGTSDNYLARNSKDYFENAADVSANIFTGLSIYDTAKRLLLGKVEDRERFKKFEEFLSQSFFDGSPISILPNIDDDVVHVFIDGEERPIYMLGDGIQAIIILTYPLFINQNEHCSFFFEEPETHLHPGLQRLFIETLLRPEFEKFQYFISSHSNHFLDLTLDYDNISVYSFEKKSNDAKISYLIENVENGQKNILELLGARASSVFLSNCTIWVEGVTDRLYLRKFLELYQQRKERKFREDYHYSFVEYGGNNITHWSFLESNSEPTINVERLCSKLFLISDNDGAGLTVDGKPNKNKLKKYQRHLKLKEVLGERYYCLHAREIENVLSPHIIKNVILEKEKSEMLDFSEFDKKAKKDLHKMPIGKLIIDTIPGIRRKYNADSGTISDKVNFCKIAISHMNSMSDLSEEAEALCEKLYDFIHSNNRLKLIVE